MQDKCLDMVSIVEATCQSQYNIGFASIELPNQLELPKYFI